MFYGNNSLGTLYTVELTKCKFKQFINAILHIHRVKLFANGQSSSAIDLYRDSCVYFKFTDFTVPIIMTFIMRSHSPEPMGSPEPNHSRFQT